MKALHHRAVDARGSRGSFAVLADDVFADAASTKKAAELRDSWTFDRQAHEKLTRHPATVEQEHVWKSFRNLERTSSSSRRVNIDVADVMWGRGLVVTETVLAQLEGRED